MKSIINMKEVNLYKKFFLKIISASIVAIVSTLASLLITAISLADNGKSVPIIAVSLAFVAIIALIIVTLNILQSVKLFIITTTGVMEIIGAIKEKVLRKGPKDVTDD